MAVQLIYTKNGQPYIDQYNQTAKLMANERDVYRKDQSSLRDAYRTQATTERDQNVTTTNQNYDKSAKQNFINYMQAQKRLPSELNALGIRGGASESSLIRLGSNYGTNVANNEAARGTAIAGINQAYEKGLSDYDRDYQAALSDYDRDYNSRLATAYATAYQNQINYEREAQQKDLEYFSGVIEGLYGDTKSYDNLIKQLQVSDDPNRDYKILLAMKAKQTLAEKLGGSSSGGGGGSSSRSNSGSGSGSGGSGDNGSINPNITAAQEKGKSMTDYYKKAMNKSSSKSNTKTVTGNYYVKKNNNLRKSNIGFYK